MTYNIFSLLKTFHMVFYLTYQRFLGLCNIYLSNRRISHNNSIFFCRRSWFLSCSSSCCFFLGWCCCVRCCSCWDRCRWLWLFCGWGYFLYCMKKNKILIDSFHMFSNITLRFNSKFLYLNLSYLCCRGYFWRLCGNFRWGFLCCLRWLFLCCLRWLFLCCWWHNWFFSRCESIGIISIICVA